MIQCYIIQCGAIITQPVFSNMLTIDNPWLTCEGKIWDVFCECKPWLLLCHGHCSGVRIIVFYFTTLWWGHQMETFSELLAICAGNSPVSGEFPAQRPVTWSFDVFFDVCPNKRLSKQSWGWWFETPSGSLWRHSNDNSTPLYFVSLGFRYFKAICSWRCWVPGDVCSQFSSWLDKLGQWSKLNIFYFLPISLFIRWMDGWMDHCIILWRKYLQFPALYQYLRMM